MIINLKDISQESIIFGRTKGKSFAEYILEIFKVNVTVQTIQISFKGIEFADTTFLLEGLVKTAHSLRTIKAILVSDIDNQDILDNLLYAVKELDMPIFYIASDCLELIQGHQTNHKLELLKFIYSGAVPSKGITTSMIKDKFDLSAPNASSKLNKLFKQGYILGSKQEAESGGLEYVYKPFVTLKLN